jgi:hypothetical protein
MYISLHQSKHVGTLVWSERLLVLRQPIGHLFESKSQFVRVDELGDQ